ncbi:hypothetical protein XAC3810_400010 [Xanthomonas citri pv. citri]|uniref:Uncharacterized protein n=1 Tax=Xanthomonas citri pv. citri TaxID=611301 RepID=A0A0U5FDM3_XANCI|nr:hypothetical protein XAC9322_420010 [Xanthomonas citri pv. citri]CEE26456.1 hypothetical protein XAC3824_460004 [Xanthomonas citri pv. citri]CEE28012.1 hypothetical protein XAC1083_420010 [Xanthomonas citri pv. citri]CEE37169.1 hypothetical protein XAC3810_400010 [Xanthomonas citri pv. citri]CEE39403.1 hypothetical protein XAC902_540010 [Xanthomonas citri pv. citri]
MDLGLRLRSAVSVSIEGVPPVRDGFYRQGLGDPLMLGKPHETSFPQEFFTVKDRFGLNSKQEGLDPTSGDLPSVLSPTRSAGRR